MSAVAPAPASAPATLDWAISSFEIYARIGRGRFGHVHKVRRKGPADAPMYAMKVLFKNELKESGVLQQLLKEVEIQSQMRHPRILRLLGVSQDARRVYLFSDLSEHGSIYAFLKRLGRFPEEITGKYLRQLLNALTYLHSKSIIHRDIKPENLLLSASGDLLLCDFGWCSSIDEAGRLTVCGTPDYLPPEMITRSNYCETVDSWCVGVLCYEFLVGRPPFLASNQHEIYTKIVAADYKCPEFMTDGPRHFLSCALRVNAEKRYTAGELFLHAWIQEHEEDSMSIIEWEKKSEAEASATTRRDPSARLSWESKLAGARGGKEEGQPVNENSQN